MPYEPFVQKVIAGKLSGGLSVAGLNTVNVSRSVSDAISLIECSCSDETKLGNRE